MKKTFIVTLACACSLSLYAQQPQHIRTDLAEHTDCVYVGLPFLVRSSHPRFSWVVPSSGNGTMQTAYQIQVATSVESLFANAYVWDSQKQAGNQSVSVPYQGAALLPSTRYYWRVKTWDNREDALVVEVPANTEAEVWLPWNGKRKVVKGGCYRFTKIRG